MLQTLTKFEAIGSGVELLRLFAVECLALTLTIFDVWKVSSEFVIFHKSLSGEKKGNERQKKPMKRALTYNKFPLVSLAMFYPQYGFVQSSEILFSEVRP